MPKVGVKLFGVKLYLTFSPCSASNNGLQYTGTGTDTELLVAAALGIWGWNLAGRLHP